MPSYSLADYAAVPAVKDRRPVNTASYEVDKWLGSIPREIDESAWVDGASRFQAFIHVVLPLIKPGLVAACILCLQLAWNDFLFAAVLTNNATRTLPVLMARASARPG